MNTVDTSLAAGLTGFEGWVTRQLTAWNTRPRTKAWSAWFVRRVSHLWIQAAVRNRLEIHGAAHIRDLKPPRGVLLVANHRTFWDMYVATSCFTAHNDATRALFFPVRRRFFYTHPLGPIINFAVAGGSMWPPMAAGFDRARRDLVGLHSLARVLDQPHTLAGIHPEGTRSRHPDPLQLLPAKGGAGRLVQACHPETVVVPYFLQGMTNDLPAEVRDNFRAPGQRQRPPIQLVFGRPRPAGSLPREGAPKALSAWLLDEVRQLGASLREGAA